MDLTYVRSNSNGKMESDIRERILRRLRAEVIREKSSLARCDAGVYFEKSCKSERARPLLPPPLRWATRWEFANGVCVRLHSWTIRLTDF